jgi:hypothetical protein
VDVGTAPVGHVDVGAHWLFVSGASLGPHVDTQLLPSLDLYGVDPLHLHSQVLGSLSVPDGHAETHCWLAPVPQNT